jgi:hypothetical protein
VPPIFEPAKTLHEIKGLAVDVNRITAAPRWSRSRQLDRPLRTSSTENERSMMGNAKLDACREYNQRITNATEDRTVNAVAMAPPF